MKPRVNIITVVFNGGEHLETTIQSVLSQTYDAIDYIIIDGGSKDNTVSIIKKYEDKLAYWISEPDKGLYDAMNKAIRAAKGDYLWFINTGDVIYDNDTLRKALATDPGADVYYGETEDVTMDGQPIGMRRLSTPENLDWKSLSMGMVVSHQSIIVKRSVAPEYDMRYRLASDIDWVIRVLKNSKRIVNTHLILSKFQVGGLSRKNISKGLKERFRIMKEHYGLASTVMKHFIIASKFFYFLLRHRRF